jgi:hypothetical protein
MTITGGCLCGAVRYSIAADPLVVRTCWCTDCQKFGAGSATVNVVFPAEAVSLEGTLTDYASTADSGNKMHRGFCPACGTPVTTGSEARPHLMGIRGGTLDDPEIAKPHMTSGPEARQAGRRSIPVSRATRPSRCCRARPPRGRGLYSPTSTGTGSGAVRISDRLQRGGSVSAMSSMRHAPSSRTRLKTMLRGLPKLAKSARTRASPPER